MISLSFSCLISMVIEEAAWEWQVLAFRSAQRRPSLGLPAAIPGLRSGAGVKRAVAFIGLSSPWRSLAKCYEMPRTPCKTHLKSRRDAEKQSKAAKSQCKTSREAHATQLSKGLGLPPMVLLLPGESQTLTVPVKDRRERQVPTCGLVAGSRPRHALFVPFSCPKSHFLGAKTWLSPRIS